MPNLRAEVVGVAALALLMAGVHAWWPSPPPTETAEVVGAVLMVLLAGAAWHLPLGPKRWQGWLALAGFSVLLAAMFWAANQGLDLIKPPGSRRHDAAAAFAGLELWTLLCPGLTCVALSGLARWLVLPSSHLISPRGSRAVAGRILYRFARPAGPSAASRRRASRSVDHADTRPSQADKRCSHDPSSRPHRSFARQPDP